MPHKGLCVQAQLCYVGNQCWRQWEQKKSQDGSCAAYAQVTAGGWRRVLLLCNQPLQCQQWLLLLQPAAPVLATQHSKAAVSAAATVAAE